MEYAIVPYSYASPFTDTLRLPERLFELGFGAPVTIKQAYKPDGLGGSKLGFGASVYDAAFVLSNFIARFRFEPRICWCPLLVNP